MRKFLAAFLLLTATVCAADRAALIQEIKQTEHDFCALLAREGKQAAFSTYVAIPSLYALTREEYRAKTPNLNPGETAEWHPIFTSVSSSGELGYVWSVTHGTTPATPDGKPGRSGEGLTFSVWRKQADGTWRFIFDAGSGPSPEVLQSVIQTATELSAKESQTAKPTSPSDGIAAHGELREVLAGFFTTAKTEGRNATLLKHMTDEALMLDTNVCTKTMALEKLPTGAADARQEGALLYLNVASAGDLALALGEWPAQASNGQNLPPRLCALVWEKQTNGSWLFTTYHELPVRPERFATLKARIATLPD